MSMKEITVPQFKFKSPFGTFAFKDVPILYDAEEAKIDPANFNQDEDEFYLDTSIARKMLRAAVKKYISKNLASIASGEYLPNAVEIKELKEFLGINASELATLMGVDRSTTSRALNEGKVTKQFAMYLFDLVKEEIETPGYNQNLLLQIKKPKAVRAFKELSTPPSIAAKYIIHRFEELEDPISNLKLQKILYYAQGIGLGKYNHKVLDTNIYAWKLGPVIPEIYHSYKKFENSPIELDKKDKLPALSEEAKTIIEETINIYGKFSGWKLSEMTHEESPWLETDQNEIITDKKMILHFRKSIY